MTIAFRTATLAVLVWLSLATAWAVENTWVYAVQLDAKVQSSPARIELSWIPDEVPVLGYTIQRRAPGETAWGAAVALDALATRFVDESVSAGSVYEYQVTKTGLFGYIGYGYISAAIDAPPVDFRGRVLLVVEESLLLPLATELAQFEQDLIGDGWTVSRLSARKDEMPAAVKARIKAAYAADPSDSQALLLVGRIPIVRSGNQNVDGHLARPMPADVFYGDMDGTWTDDNGDGIYDQSMLPSDVELQIGRLDFADLPGADSLTPHPNEIELTRRYLWKNHAYRHAILRPTERAIIGNQIGNSGGQAYAAIGYRNFSALVGSDKVLTVATELDVATGDRWLSRLTRDDYLWAYGCGAGSDISASNLGTHGASSDLWSVDFADFRPRGTFYLLFGSWFADWAQRDNLLRSALTAPEYGLAAVWAGRPHIFLHGMGAGETLGQGIRLSQNNDGQRYQNQLQRQLRGVHLALMGDPTLRLRPVAPPANLTARAEGDRVYLAWQKSSDPVVGYHIYRGASAAGPFRRVTTAPVTETQFIDRDWALDGDVYQVRAVTLETTPSGRYYNTSQAASAPNVHTGRLINLSVLTTLTSPDDSFILGFVVTGFRDGLAKPVVIRAAGPALARFDVATPLRDPKMELYAGDTKIGENNNWGGTSALQSAMAAVGAFAYDSPASLDSAVATQTTSAKNTVHISSADGGTGSVLAEVYDANPDAAINTGAPRLVNVSVRKHIGTVSTLGFVVRGGTVRALIRAIGPSLASFDVSGVVADPQLTLFSHTTPIASNDNWGGDPALQRVFNVVGAFELPAGSKDAALIASLPPGEYTVQVRGVNGTGVALAEVYEIP